MRQLVGMRYRLLWAHARTRNGRIALFVVFYLAVVCVIALFALGGVAAGVAAIRAGRPELAARVVLGGIFVNGLVASVILGFGTNSVFSDGALRRYPLTRAQRLAAVQASGILEPLWLILLALDCGLAAGYSVLGVCGPWAAMAAALLLLASNYMLARILLQLTERLIQTGFGVGILLGAIGVSSMLPVLAGETVAERLAVLTPLLQWTPPAQAAWILGGDAPGPHLGLLGCWCGALAAAILYLDRHPLTVNAPSRTPPEWDTLFDRAARCFGPRYGPVAGKTLRYYLRSFRVRYNVLLTVPMLGFFTYTQGRSGDPMGLFVNALSAVAAVGFLATAVMAVNQFGYDGGGFRRYFLLPAAPEEAFRATSLASLALSLAQVPPALAGWLLLAPLPTSPLMWLMLVTSALGGALFFHAASVWTSIYSPRRTEFTSGFGSNLSLGGNVMVIGGMLTVVFFPAVLRSTGRLEIVMRLWWMYPLFFLASAGLYGFGLTAGARAFAARRERMLGVLEGRQ